MISNTIPDTPTPSPTHQKCTLTIKHMTLTLEQIVVVMRVRTKSFFI